MTKTQETRTSMKGLLRRINDIRKSCPREILSGNRNIDNSQENLPEDIDPKFQEYQALLDHLASTPSEEINREIKNNLSKISEITEHYPSLINKYSGKVSPETLDSYEDSYNTVMRHISNAVGGR